MQRSWEMVSAPDTQCFCWRLTQYQIDNKRKVICSNVATRGSKPKKQVAILSSDLSKVFDVASHFIIFRMPWTTNCYSTMAWLACHTLTWQASCKTGHMLWLACGGLERYDPISPDMGVAQRSSVSNFLFFVNVLEQKLNHTASQLAGWFIWTTSFLSSPIHSLSNSICQIGQWDFWQCL